MDLIRHRQSTFASVYTTEFDKEDRAIGPLRKQRSFLIKTNRKSILVRSIPMQPIRNRFLFMTARRQRWPHQRISFSTRPASCSFTTSGVTQNTWTSQPSALRVQPGSVGYTGRSIACNETIATPLVSKKQMTKMDFTSLSSTLDGNGEILYRPPQKSPQRSQSDGSSDCFQKLFRPQREGVFPSGNVDTQIHQTTVRK